MIRTFQQDEPLPGVQPSYIVHICQDTGSQQPRKDVGSYVTSVPDGHTKGRFFFCVPGRGHQRNHWEKGSLSQPDTKATDQEGPARRHGSHASSDDRPCHHVGGHLIARKTFSEVDTSRKLGDDVATGHC